ncbi:hypothetical protein [Streptomyces sp. CLCI03]
MSRSRLGSGVEIALGCEGAAAPIGDVFADGAIALIGKARTAALCGDHLTIRRYLAEGRRIFDRVGWRDQTSDCAVPFWRANVFTSALVARLGGEIAAVVAAGTPPRQSPWSPAAVCGASGDAPGPPCWEQ